MPAAALNSFTGIVWSFDAFDIWNSEVGAGRETIARSVA
jgi:hypothetical protein